MTTIKSTKASGELERLIDRTAQNHEPITIAGERHNAVLIAEDDWSAIQETLHLLSIPGMRESIKSGLETPVDECDRELEW